MKHYFVRVAINRNKKPDSFGTVISNENIEDFLSQTENLDYKVQEVIPICEEIYTYIMKLQMNIEQSKRTLANII